MSRKQMRGSIITRDGKLYARVRFFEGGQERTRERVVSSGLKRDGKDVLRGLMVELEAHGLEFVDAAEMRFNDLAGFYERKYLQEATYSPDGRKIAGRRSLVGIPAQMRALRMFFGAMRLRDIRVSDLEEFKVRRMNEPKERGGGRRSITDVNRTLALMRHMLNVARRQDWITVSPFERGAAIIKTADEPKGGRILSRAEELALLDQCTGPRAHLRPIVICGLDTGMRFSELRNLTWRDVSLFARTVTAVSYKGDTRQERTIPMTSRVVKELEGLWERSSKLSSESVFGIKDTIKRSFGTAARLAGLEGLTPHDLRHTYCSRLAQSGMQVTEIMRMSGHTQVQTLARYTHADENTFNRAVSALEQFSLFEAGPDDEDTIEQVN